MFGGNGIKVDALFINTKKSLGVYNSELSTYPLFSIVSGI